MNELAIARTKLLKDCLLDAPDGQLDASTFKIIKEWGEVVTAQELLLLLDDCAAFALASGFVMTVLHEFLLLVLKDEGFDSYEAYIATNPKRAGVMP